MHGQDDERKNVQKVAPNEEACKRDRQHRRLRSCTEACSRLGCCANEAMNRGVAAICACKHRTWTQCRCSHYQRCCGNNCYSLVYAPDEDAMRMRLMKSCRHLETPTRAARLPKKHKESFHVELGAAESIEPRSLELGFRVLDTPQAAVGDGKPSMHRRGAQQQTSGAVAVFRMQMQVNLRASMNRGLFQDASLSPVSHLSPTLAPETDDVKCVPPSNEGCKYLDIELHVLFHVWALWQCTSVRSRNHSTLVRGSCQASKTEAIPFQDLFGDTVCGKSNSQEIPPQSVDLESERRQDIQTGQGEYRKGTDVDKQQLKFLVLPTCLEFGCGRAPHFKSSGPHFWAVDAQSRAGHRAQGTSWHAVEEFGKHDCGQSTCKAPVLWSAWREHH